jgi:hypothetical protein
LIAEAPAHAFQFPSSHSTRTIEVVDDQRLALIILEITWGKSVAPRSERLTQIVFAYDGHPERRAAPITPNKLVLQLFSDRAAVDNCINDPDRRICRT